MRAGRWKLIEWFEDGRTKLFDLAADVAESADLSSAQPDVTRKLLGQLRAWRESVGARLPDAKSKPPARRLIRRAPGVTSTARIESLRPKNGPKFASQIPKKIGF